MPTINNVVLTLCFYLIAQRKPTFMIMWHVPEPNCLCSPRSAFPMTKATKQRVGSKLRRIHHPETRLCPSSCDHLRNQSKKRKMLFRINQQQTPEKFQVLWRYCFVCVGPNYIERIHITVHLVVCIYHVCKFYAHHGAIYKHPVTLLFST